MAVSQDQALQASAAIDVLNVNTNELATDLATAQAALAAAQAYNPALQIQLAQDRVTAIQTEQTAVANRLAAMTNVVNNWNTANPGAPVALG